MYNKFFFVLFFLLFPFIGVSTKDLNTEILFVLFCLCNKKSLGPKRLSSLVERQKNNNKIL